LSITLRAVVAEESGSELAIEYSRIREHKRLAELKKNG